MKNILLTLLFFTANLSSANAISFEKVSENRVYQQTVKVDLSQSCFIGQGDATFVDSCLIPLSFLPAGVILKATPEISEVKFYGATSSLLEISIDGGSIKVKYKDGNFEDGESDKIKSILSNLEVTFQGPKIQ